MAHIRPMPACHGVNCNKVATKEVYGIRNEFYGRYCATCAKRKLKEVERQEAQATRDA